MKTLVRFTVSSLGVLAAALLLAVAPAQATLFHLTEWNETNLDNSTAEVTVDVSLNGSGNTVLHIVFVAGNFTKTPAGIDQFGYQAASNGTGPAGWADFTGSGNMDGFGSFLRQSASPAGTDLAFDIIVLGNQLAVLDAATDFAAHVRFDSPPLGCSGFVGGENIATKSEAGCGTSVAEPPILALAGFGLLGLALVSRRWRMQ